MFLLCLVLAIEQIHRELQTALSGVLESSSGIVTPGGGEATMRHRGRPLLRDTRRTRAWPVLATCVIVIAALGLRLRGQGQPDGFDPAVDTAMVASFSSHQGVLPWLGWGRPSRSSQSASP